VGVRPPPHTPQPPIPNPQSPSKNIYYLTIIKK